MPNAPGLRDQRLRLYARADRGSDGYVQAVFVFLYERWGRLDESHVAVVVMEERLQMHLDASAEFADEVKVPLNGLIIDTIDGRAWWVRGVNGVRALRRVLVGVERVSDEQFQSLTVYDRPDVDAVHAITPNAAPPTVAPI